MINTKAETIVKWFPLFLLQKLCLTIFNLKRQILAQRKCTFGVINYINSKVMEKLPNKYELIIYFLIANFFIFILYLFANENTQMYHPELYRNSNMNFLGLIL